MLRGEGLREPATNFNGSGFSGESCRGAECGGGGGQEMLGGRDRSISGL